MAAAISRDRAEPTERPPQGIETGLFGGLEQAFLRVVGIDVKLNLFACSLEKDCRTFIEVA
jgi:hypothetical protein